MNVFRHHHIAADDKVVSVPHDFQGTLKQAARRRRAKIWEPTITTEGEEVKTSALLITDKSLRHPNILHPRSLRDLGHPIIYGWSDLDDPPGLALESQIEPWLAPANLLLAGAEEAAQRNAKGYDAENLPKR
jgi:hypothetical protein